MRGEGVHSRGGGLLWERKNNNTPLAFYMCTHKSTESDVDTKHFRKFEKFMMQSQLCSTHLFGH